ncbi:transcription factor asR4-like [Phragmites australis]|uniref:transcription factor asR4-like n=1 Tax=Phragmites australis TaxID=29695 RepID=UPI002D797745|nr:transcription factor asR4-like [Phragmites australis]
MVAISMYRGNLHLGGVTDAAEPRRWELPRPALSAKRFRRLLRSRSLTVERLAGEPPRPGSSASSPSSAEPAGEAPGQEEGEANEEEEQGQQQQQPDDGEQQQQQEEGEVEQQHQQQQEEEEEQEEGAVEDADMDDAGEVVVEGDGNGDAEEGQGESEGVDPNPEVNYLDGVEERKTKLNEKLDTLNKKKHDLVQMLKQVLNAEEEIRRRSMQASLRAAMPQPSENGTDGSSVSRLVPRMTVDVNFGEVAGDSDAGSNQGTPGRPLHHLHNISPSTASFARSPFGSLQHNSGHTPRSPATFSTASPSRFAVSGHQGHPPGPVSLPGCNYVASSPSPAASGGSSSVFKDSRPPNSM